MTHAFQKSSSNVQKSGGRSAQILRIPAENRLPASCTRVTFALLERVAKSAQKFTREFSAGSQTFGAPTVQKSQSHSAAITRDGLLRNPSNPRENTPNRRRTVTPSQPASLSFHRGGKISEKLAFSQRCMSVQVANCKMAREKPNIRPSQSPHKPLAVLSAGNDLSQYQITTYVHPKTSVDVSRKASKMSLFACMLWFIRHSPLHIVVSPLFDTNHPLGVLFQPFDALGRLYNFRGHASTNGYGSVDISTLIAVWMPLNCLPMKELTHGPS
jgi:hypothetical protein